jgi:hypothetical protein
MFDFVIKVFLCEFSSQFLTDSPFICFHHWQPKEEWDLKQKVDQWTFLWASVAFLLVYTSGA